MKRAPFWLAASLALVTFCPAPAQTEKKTEVDPAEWVPADAVVYLGVTDVAQTWADFQKTAGYKLMEDETVADAVPGFSLFGPAIKKLQERVAKTLDVQPAQLKNPFTGPLAFYLAASPGGKFKDLEPGLIARVGDTSLLQKYYETAVTKLKETTKHSTDSVGSTTIDVFTKDESEGGKKDRAKGPPGGPPGEDETEPFGPGGLRMGESPEKMAEDFVNRLLAAENLPPTLAACLTEDRLIVAGSAEQVRAILKRDKDAASLAGTDDHKALLRQLKPVGSVHFQVNLPRIIELARAEAKEADAKDFSTWLKVLGAEGLRSAVGHLRVGASSYDSKFELLFLMSGERSGLAKILSMDNQRVAPPAFVSGEACLYVGANLNASKLLDDVERMLRQTDPDKADELQKSMQEVALPSGDKIDIRKEFLDHITGPLTVALSFTQPLGPQCARLLVTLGQRDQSAMTRFLTAFAPLLQPRDLRGTQVFDLAMAPGISVAASSDRLLLGSAAAVESGLQPAAGPALAESEGWRRAARQVPEEAWLAVYFDQRALLTTALELAKNKDELAAGPTDAGAMVLRAMFGELLTGADDAKLKQLRKLLKYTGRTIFTVATTPDGVRVTSVNLRPED